MLINLIIPIIILLVILSLIYIPISISRNQYQCLDPLSSQSVKLFIGILCIFHFIENVKFRDFYLIIWKMFFVFSNWLNSANIRLVWLYWRLSAKLQREQCYQNQWIFCKVHLNENTCKLFPYPYYGKYLTNFYQTKKVWNLTVLCIDKGKDIHLYTLKQRRRKNRGEKCLM